MLTPEEEQKLDKIIQETTEYLSVRDYDHVPWLAEKLKELNEELQQYEKYTTCPIHGVVMYHHIPTETYACQLPTCFFSSGTTKENLRKYKEMRKNSVT